MEEGTELLQRLRHAWGLDLPAEGSGGAGAGGGRSAGAQEEQQGQGQGRGHHSAPGPLPMFTSCCPGWVTACEKSFPELLPHLSTCKSPQQMMGAVVKSHFAAKLGKRAQDICLVGATSGWHLPLDLDITLLPRLPALAPPLFLSRLVPASLPACIALPCCLTSACPPPAHPRVPYRSA